MFGDHSLSSLEPGTRIDLVVLVTAHDLHGGILRTLWHSEICRCQGDFTTGVVLTMYGIQFSGRYGDSYPLRLLSDTLIIPRPPLDGDSFRRFKDVGAGIGGMALGCTLLGGTCAAALDRNPLACEVLNRQFDVVIEGDLACPAIRQ